MIKFELDTELRQLRAAFPRSELKEDEVEVWFKKFKHWSLKRFQSAIDKAIETESKFPSIAKILEIGRDFDDEQLKTTPKQHCDSCLSSGIINATLGGYSFAFRCDDCRNWDGYFSENIPLWSAIYIGEGYAPVKGKKTLNVVEPESDEWLDAI